jgi:hypothetical protein
MTYKVKVVKSILKMFYARKYALQVSKNVLLTLSHPFVIIQTFNTIVQMALAAKVYHSKKPAKIYRQSYIS